MTGMQRAVTAYDQAAGTMPPLQQIVLLYDGAIRRLREARDAIEGGRVKDRHVAVEKAATIVGALQGCLDLDRGGEIAANLDRLYTHLTIRMHQINVANDPTVCDEVAERLGELRMAWSALSRGDGPDGGAPPTDGPVAERQPAGRALSA